MTNQADRVGATGGYRVTGFPGRPVFQDARGLVVGLPASAPEGAGVVTLLEGVIVGDDAQAWVAAVRGGSAEPATLLVDRLDPTGAATLRWTLTNAVPTSLSAAGVQAGAADDGNEVAVESVEIAYETLTISAP
ncbi:phage tail protein [Azospirillum griseum]|uniref:Phage tail protein n=1 Tax=Azospirillum griseum TaxID=2496639 RepID=A0A431VFW9_9PROT|nr:phage tail protein [Azospirillum griseum]RTR18351.1 hypothetical protein EJ903_15975 [Azospirillum griseum]